MTGDAFRAGPAGRAGRAVQAGARTLLDQEFDSGTLYALRAAVQAHADRVGLPEERADEVVLAVHELAANAIAHGAGHGHLRMWDLAGALSCEVVDDGAAGAGAAPSPAGAGAASSPAGAGDPPGPSEAANPWPAAVGHGLWLVRQVADHLDLRSGPRGTRAIATFALPEDH